MNQPGRVSASLLRMAAGRWPAELQARMIEEWNAELAVMRHEPGRYGRQVSFVASLVLSTLRRDDGGLPRPGGGVNALPAVALLLAGVAQFLTPILILEAAFLTGTPAGDALPGTTRLGLLLLITAVLGLLLGLGLGRFCPAEPGERFGAATSAVLAATCLTGTFLIQLATGTGSFQPDPTAQNIGLLLAALVWGPAIGFLGVRAVRWSAAGHRWRTRVGAPLLAVAAAILATVAGALPMLVPAVAHGGARFAVSLLTAPESWNDLVPIDYPYPFYRAVGWLPLLVGSGLLVLVYGLRATRLTTPVTAAEPDRTGTENDYLPSSRVTAAAATALVVGVLTWGYATTLEPLMDAMNDTYNDRYGYEQISTSAFIGHQDFRWGGILLAVLGFVAVTARHRRPGIAGGVLAMSLLALDGFAYRATQHPLAGPRSLLAGAAAAILVAWWASGPAQESVSAAALRRRLTVPAVLAAGALPQLYVQLPEPGEHSYLPIGFFLPMVVLPAVGAAFAAVCALAARRRPSSRTATVLLTVLPVPAVLYGAAVLSGNYLRVGIDGVYPDSPFNILDMPTLLTVLHLAAVFVTVRDRLPRTGPRTVRIVRSVAIGLGGLVAAFVLPALSVFLLYPVNGLFGMIAHRSVFDDGVDCQPGVVALLFLIGQWTANGGRFRAARGEPQPIRPDQEATEPRQPAESVS